MIQVGLAEVKAKLSSLIRRVEAGEEILITLHDRPVAALVPASKLGRPESGSNSFYSGPGSETPAVVREFSGATYSPLGKDNRINEDSNYSVSKGEIKDAGDGMSRRTGREVIRDAGPNFDPDFGPEFFRESRRSRDPEMIEKTTHFLLTLKPEERISLLEDALAALAEREAAHNLIGMMGSDPDVVDVPRRR